MMRFSEIVKTKDWATPKKTAPVFPPVKESLPEKDFLREIESAKKEVEDRLQREFVGKIESMQAEFMRLMESRILEEQKRSEERLKGLEKQRDDARRQLEDFQKENQTLREVSISLDSEKRQILEAKEKTLQDLQKKIWDLDEQLKRKEVPAEKSPETLPAETSLRQETPPPAPFIEPPSYQREDETPAVIPQLPEMVIDSGIRARYDALAQAAGEVFERVAEKQPMELEAALRAVSDMVDSALVEDADFINIVMEPYPAAPHYIYHAANCAVLSALLGMDLHIKKEQLKDLALSALLHDVGLINIRESLDYPGQLAKDTKAEVLKHPQRGAAMLEGIVNEEVLKAVLQHHEIGNGTGYPEGLAGETIHLYARIISVADSFEAMTHERPYRSKPFDVSHAIKEMVEKGRGLYDRDDFILSTALWSSVINRLPA
jgi:HD-GYP domain-containing protein (c-di-GMP phosphodiesterase class II)